MDVLIVEPSKDLALVIAEALARQEISSNIAHSSQAAIKIADTQTPKTVVLELLMHGHNGLEFIYEFKTYAEWLDIPIILYTNLSADELNINQNLARDMGIVANLYKPTNSLEDLVSSVESVLN